MKVTVIQRKRDTHKKKVAAYCRVSTEHINQDDSFEQQSLYYSRFIRSNSDWEFAGIYSDMKSGLKARNREGFLLMVSDALDGKIDMIVVKSISRFSRNIVDAHKYVELLSGNGVDVWFQKENIFASDPSCSLLFSFLAAVSQDESRSISENVKWSYRERFKRGEYKIGNNRIIGYDCMNGIPVPNGDAKYVRMIFSLYIDGVPVERIRVMLAEAGLRSRKGGMLSHSGILYILSNEVYKGDRILYKTRKERSVYISGSHEAIVDPDTWQRAQERRG